MAADPRRVKELFVAALDVPDAPARQAFLEGACGGDADLRQRLAVLLRAHDDPASVLEQPLAAGPSTPAAAETASGGEAAGLLLAGRYRLVEPIGEGGMGTVWLAEQTDPVQRRVAVKLIKAGMGSRAVLARFEQERQALALMDHPHIAKVHDAGAAPDGRPYFVMELVQGIPITGYCDLRRLTVRQRLELFVPVCRALQHAHQKGIIHRDIKPSNVLVALYDGKPVPKVIDFGIAKAASDPLTPESLHTGLGTVVGTAEYMSPEQASLNRLDVDTRSDVYSLGVLLYELLAGSPPFSRRGPERAGLLEVLRQIREQEPSRLSVRLGTTEGLASLAANRGTEPGRLVAQVRGELDWIVMKCLEKDRDRRYETADALAGDVRRYLANEPVLAGPPSAWYRLRKFVRRNRGRVAAAALVLGALLAGVAVSTWQAVRATQAIEQARQAAEAEAAQRIQARTAGDLLESLFADFDPWAEERSGPDFKSQLIDRLDRVAALLEGGYTTDPLTRARLRRALGVAQLGAGEAARSVALLESARQECEAAVGPDHPDTLMVRHRLSDAYLAARRGDDAVQLSEETLKRCQSRLPADDDHTLWARQTLANAYLFAGRVPEAIPLYEAVFTAREARLDPDHPDMLSAWHNLGTAYARADRLADEIRLHDRTAKRLEARLGRDHAQTLVARHNLAIAYRKDGQLARAIGLHEEVLKVRTDKLGPSHPATMRSRNNLANAYRDTDRHAEGISLHEENLKLKLALYGADHPDTLLSRHNLAMAYGLALPKRTPDAIRLHEENLKLCEARLGPDDLVTLKSRYGLAVAYREAKRTADAIRLHEDNLPRCEARKDPGYWLVKSTLVELVELYSSHDRVNGQEPYLRRLLQNRRQVVGPESTDAATVIASLGFNLIRQHRYAEAEPLLRDGLKVCERTLPNDWNTFHFRCWLGESLLGQHKHAEAEPLLLQGYQGMKEREARIPAASKPRLTRSLERLVRLYEAWGKPDEAARWRKELEGRVRPSGPDQEEPRKQ